MTKSTMKSHQPSLLDKFEAEIIDIFLKFAEVKGQNANFSQIGALLYIRGNLTQKQLVELTGLSQASISTMLNLLVDLGAVAKKLIPGGHQFTYFPVGTISSSVDKITDSFQKTRQDLTKIVAQLQSLSSDESDVNIILLGRLANIWQFLSFLELLLTSTNRRPKTTNSWKVPDGLYNFEGIERTPVKEMDPKQDPYRGQVAELEQAIVHILREILINTRQKPVTAACLAYLFTRKSVTQQKLQELTGFSSGAISTSLQYLLAEGFATRVKPGIGAYQYSLKDIQALKQVYLKNIGLVVDSKSTLLAMKEQMTNKRAALEQDPRYQRILGFIHDFIDRFRTIENFLEKK